MRKSSIEPTDSVSNIQPENISETKRQQKNIGLSPSAFQWFESYLSQRYQAVPINSVSSDKLPLASGVWQGSVLGALLFNIYVNDMPNVVKLVQLLATWMTKLLLSFTVNDSAWIA